MIVKEYKAEHLTSMGLQEHQRYLSSWVTPEMAHEIEKAEGWAFTAMEDDGEVLAVAGVIMQWQNRGMAWAYISDKVVGSKFIRIHRAASRFLKCCYLQRIEMTVDCDFEQGHRWAKRLGFTLEAECMKHYLPTGGDCALYARVLP